MPASLPTPTRDQALSAHQAGALGRAESLYRRALEENPQDIDVLHMLGVVQFERMRYRDALDLLWDAAERTEWSVPAIRHNVGLVLAQLLGREANIRQEELLVEFLARERALADARSDGSPLVSVVLYANDDAGGIARSIASVADQSYPDIELVVVDDRLAASVAGFSANDVVDLVIPVRVVRAAHHGAAACLNQGTSIARGEFVSFLISGDCYATDRIASMVDEIARKRVRWGFSLVSTGPSATRRDGETDDGPAVANTLEQQFLGSHPHSFGIVQHNLAGSSGNLFVERDFFLSIGGFLDYRYGHDWDFCLRATAIAEPVIVNRRLYFRRDDVIGPSAESNAGAIGDSERVLRDFLARALSSDPGGSNPLGPCVPGNRNLLLRIVCRSAHGALVPVDVLRTVADDWRRRERPRMPGDAPFASTEARRRTAVIVLGMHRSGTSALSRVVNLCGAFLPATVKPPKVGVNSKGFWEPEAVLELDVRVMRRLGGEWDRVDFQVPDDGESVDEFEADAHALLASEYGDEGTILLKDPRICVLAPLWHRALTSAGYRPVYVVPIRNPIEVARSLHARGDMSVAKGLALWLAYMQRVVEFADSHADVVHLRFSDLLDDWRSAVVRIAQRLDVPLDVNRSADDVDRFLEHGLRRQLAADDDLVGLLTGPDGDAISALYRQCLARCDRDKDG